MTLVLNSSYEYFHKNILTFLNNNTNNVLKNDYFKIFHNHIIDNVFNEDYIVKLIDSKFLESILNSNIDNYMINLINNIYTHCIKQNNIQLNKKCSNCDSEIYNTYICDTCGMEFTNSSIIRIEDFYKKKYSCSFNQKIKKHNPNKHCEIWLLQLQGKETVNISSENFNKIINLAKKWFNQNNNVELSCVVIRKWLKCLSLTNYNPHITWLRKQIENICNAQQLSYMVKKHSYDLTNDEIIKILEYFNEIITQFTFLIQEPKILQILKKKENS